MRFYADDWHRRIYVLGNKCQALSFAESHFGVKADRLVMRYMATVSADAASEGRAE